MPVHEQVDRQHAFGAAKNSHLNETSAGCKRAKIAIEIRSSDKVDHYLDTPPANRSSDAGLVSAVAGYSLIVARRNESFVADVQILADQLQADSVRVIGTVLNAA